MSGKVHVIALSAHAALAVALLLAPSALAIDLDTPAVVRIDVVDSGGRPVAGASLEIMPNTSDPAEGDVPVRGVTGPDGVARFKLRPPSSLAGPVGWSRRLHIDAKGLAGHRGWLVLFPGAEIEREVTLEAERRTLIHLRGPEGKPLAGQRFQIDFAEGNVGRHRDAVADQKGNYLFRHGLLRLGFGVHIGSSGHRYADAPEVTVTFSEAELPPRRRLHLALLGPDGRPAAGWFVASGVEAGVGGGPIGGPMTSYFAARELIEVPPSGQVEVAEAGERLTVVSPQGVPLMYPISPGSWPEGQHRVTLRLPPVRRYLEGRVELPGGAPAAGLAIHPHQVRFGGRYAVTVGGRWARYGNTSLWGATGRGGTAVKPFATGPDGRFRLPVYAGAKVDYRLRAPTTYAQYRPLTSPLTVVKPREALKSTKRITIVFEGPDGKAIPGMRVSSHQGYDGDEHVLSHGGYAASDRHGLHIFVEPRIDRLQIRASAQGWEELRKSIPAPGNEDRVVKVTVPKKLKMVPLSVRLLDPDGAPVDGIWVSLNPNVPRNARHSGRFADDYRARTDHEGRFRFDGAPASGWMRLYGYRDDGNVRHLPGWLEKAPAFGPEARDITIRLKRGGSVKVLLPPGPAAGPGRLYLHSVDNRLKKYYHLDHNPETGVAVARHVRPGQYAFSGIPGTGVAVEVSVGKEGVLDLRDDERYPPPGPELVATEILVVDAEGKPASGAAVRVYRTTSPGHMREGLFPAGAGLSDVAGHLGLRLVAAKQHVAVARLHGRMVGFKSFIPGAAKVKIDLVPARTVCVRLAGALEEQGSRLRLHMLGLEPREVRALVLALELHIRRWNRRPYGRGWEAEMLEGRFQQDWGGAHIATDLPSGLRCTVEVRKYDGKVLASQEVTLSARGGAVTEITFGKPKAQ